MHNAEKLFETRWKNCPINKNVTFLLPVTCKMNWFTRNWNPTKSRIEDRFSWQSSRIKGWGSKFGRTKCRMTDISKFQNCEY